MSFDGQVLCQRMLIGPWALTTLGAATVAAAATAAPLRNLRREVLSPADVLAFVIGFLPLCGTLSPIPRQRVVGNDGVSTKCKRRPRKKLVRLRSRDGPLPGHIPVNAAAGGTG